jgi:hypothetical protein
MREAISGGVGPGPTGRSRETDRRGQAAGLARRRPIAQLRQPGRAADGEDGPVGETDDRTARRNRLLTRVVIIGLGLMVLAYVIPLLIHR